MSVGWVLVGIALAAASGVPGLFTARDSRTGERLAALLLVAAAAAGITGVFGALRAGGAAEWSGAWPVPGGELSVRVDALAAVFLLPIFGISALGAVFGLEYWAQASHPGNAKRLRFVYGLITAGLATVAVAANALLFLAGWEIMALAAFVAVGTEDHLPEARKASYVYLVTTRIATLCLFAFFALVHRATGSFALSALTQVDPGVANALFVLGTVAFSLKAGAMPLHVWLPGAHAAAPSHVSALMSGVLIKIGIYGLVRMLTMLPSPPMWWGLVLLALGVLSGVLGVAYALGQHDLKRLLAYHSIENIGIILLGLGLATVGRAAAMPALVVLGLAGSLLHVWNHGLFKALLFLSAGSVVHACHTREMDRLGGLLRRMPWTASLFLVGAVAICGLPPLNGFVSELLLYVGFFRALPEADPAVALPPALGAAALALSGGLALACFAKAFGAVFLGHPRSSDGAGASRAEAGLAMRLPMLLLAACCALIGLWPQGPAVVLDRAVTAFEPSRAHPALSALMPLEWVSLAAAATWATIAVCAGLLAWARRRAPERRTVTWDCGYAAPSARMQYTSSSFADTFVRLFAWALRPRSHRPTLAGPFPKNAAFDSHVPDAVLDDGIEPALRQGVKAAGLLKFLQPGSLHLYLLYVLLALLGAMAWMRGHA